MLVGFEIDVGAQRHGVVLGYTQSSTSTIQVVASLYGLPLATILVGLVVLGTVPSLLGVIGGAVALLGAFLCAGLRTE